MVHAKVTPLDRMYKVEYSYAYNGHRIKYTDEHSGREVLVSLLEEIPVIDHDKLFLKTITIIEHEI